MIACQHSFLNNIIHENMFILFRQNNNTGHQDYVKQK
jgi:hypothetical protein